MIKEILEEHVQVTQRVFDDRSETVGASEIGQCERRVGYAKRSADPDPDYKERWGAHTRGTLMEQAFWLPAMRRKFGEKLLWAGDDQRTLVSGFLSATPDGLVIDQPRDALAEHGVEDGSCFVVECKSIDPRVDLRREKEEHAFQVQVQLGLIRELTPWKPEAALISYIDASFWDDVSEFVVKFNPRSYARAKSRAERILSAGFLRPEGLIAGGFECKWCPYAARCGVQRRNMPPNEEVDALSAAGLTELQEACKLANQIRDRRDRAVSEYNGLAEDIKDILRREGVRRVPHLVSWTEVKGRTTYDYAKLKKAMIQIGVDIDLYSKAGEPSDRLTIDPTA